MEDPPRPFGEREGWEVRPTLADIRAGGNRCKSRRVLSEPGSWQGRMQSALVTLLPLSTVIFRRA
nr:hypothetical protein DWF04_16760 [Cereibacter sphaeroides f. sp. denitrificans]